MCGRFNLHAKLNRVLQQLGAQSQLEDWPLRYNVAPTQDVLVCRLEDSQRVVVPMRWGLIPSWAKDPKIGNSLLDARADTVATKPSFRAAFKRRRCLIPTTGYYEWKREGKCKQPFVYETGDVFAIAGLWETWNDLESCTLITTDANELAAQVHDRMPVILDATDFDTWLAGEPGEAEKLLVPYEGELTARPVSTVVNNAE